MSIEAITGCCDDHEMSACEYMKALHWNGREVTLFQLQMMYMSDNLLDPAYAGMKKCIAIYGKYDIYNYPIGQCLRGHDAYYIFHQDNYAPIFLCNRDRCPFEYYEFKRYVGGGKQDRE